MTRCPSCGGDIREQCEHSCSSCLGYGIRREAKTRSAGRLSLDPGTLYRTLRRLQDAGLIDESDRRPAPDLDDQRRRYYTLTNLGRRVAVEEVERLDDLVKAARMGKLMKDPETAR